MTEAGPILLGGLDHSGKSQLRLALELVPDVAWTRRAEPWSRHAGRLGDVRDPRVAGRAIDRLVADPRLADLGPDRSRLRCDLPAALAGATTQAALESRLLGLVHAGHAASRGRDRWGIQEAGIERWAATVLDAFPDARSVILVRDPRDRLAAILAAGARPGAAGPATAAWRSSVRQARAAAARHPERVLLVRTEDLATRPVETLKRVCGHIGAAYDEAMVHPDGADPYGALAATVGLWRRALSPGQIALVEALAGRAMAALGYSPEPTRLGRADRLRFWLVDTPLGLGRLAAAGARRAVAGIGRPA